MTTVLPLPKRIYLLRHAKSGWAQPGERDFDRTLNDAGYAEAERVAGLAASKGYMPDLVVSSSAKRCRETAEAIRSAFPTEIECRFVDELYNCPADTYLEILASLTEFSSIMLVGHNPAIEEVLFMLVGSEAAQEAVPQGFPTSGLAVLDYDPDTRESGSGHWTLSDFLVG
ncbi:MAG: histidine phosphatase family protein [Rhizobium sp.]